MQSDIQLSIALLTRNRPDSLKRCLQSVREQSVQPFEILVSDDSDENAAGETLRVAEEHGAWYTPGPRRGLYANRNHAACACTGTHVRTMDDDHTLPKGHLAGCIEAIRRDPKAIWTTGEIGILDGKIISHADFASQLHPSGVGSAITDPDDNWAIADGSTIYPREIFSQGLRMIEEFKYGASYLEFGIYLYHRGWRSRCIRDALVEHHLDAGTLARRSPESSLFASLCFNLYFRPGRMHTIRYLLPYVARPRGWRLLPGLPAMLKNVRRRWSA